MTPAVGAIIAVYVGFRIIEILAQGRARHSSDGTRIAVLSLGIIALIIVGLTWADLMFSGMSAATTLTH